MFLAATGREVGDVYSKTSFPDSSSENITLLNRFVKLENTEWKGAADSAIDKVDHTSFFYQVLCESAYESGQIFWHQLFANNGLIAVHLIIRRGSTIWVVKTAFDDIYSRYSPGSVALTDLLELSIDNLDIHSMRMITNYQWLEKWRPSKEVYYGVRVHFHSL